MAIDQQHKHLDKLCIKYINIREEFKGLTTEMRMAEIHAQHDILIRRGSMRPYINRDFAMAGCHGTIHGMEDIIRIRLIDQQLPDVETLKIMPDALSQLLELL